MKTTLYIILTTFLFISVCVRGFAAPVNVNTADAGSLAESLAGIGPKVAVAIVEYRESNGPFKSVGDLLKVKGIGPKLLEKNKTDILISDQTSTANKE